VKRRVRFLSVEQVLEMHDALLARFGGSAGGGARGSAYEGVDAPIQAVKNSYYETIEELAAPYAVYIVQGQVFLDGNKRAGAAAMLVFLDLQQRAEAGEGVSSLAGWIAGVLHTRRVDAKHTR